jgi:hypothetical protein
MTDNDGDFETIKILYEEFEMTDEQLSEFFIKRRHEYESDKKKTSLNSLKMRLEYSEDEVKMLKKQIEEQEENLNE